MTSDIQLEANRSNAQKSTGPTSEAGKAITRFNATRHGLTSHVACMTWEDRDAFNQFCLAITSDLKPEGAVEAQLAQSIAGDHWRLNRARAIEENLFALGFENSTFDAGEPQATAALSQAETFRDNLKSFNLITLYEARINRNLHRNMDRLQQLQSDRHASRANHHAVRANRRANRRAATLSAFTRSASNNATLEAARAGNGFVFSDPEIALAARGQNLSVPLAEATAIASGQAKSPKSTGTITYRDAA